MNKSVRSHPNWEGRVVVKGRYPDISTPDDLKTKIHNTLVGWCMSRGYSFKRSIFAVTGRVIDTQSSEFRLYIDIMIFDHDVNLMLKREELPGYDRGMSLTETTEFLRFGNESSRCVRDSVLMYDPWKWRTT